LTDARATRLLKGFLISGYLGEKHLLKEFANAVTIVGMTQSKRAAAEDKAMTAGDLQQICIDSSAESKSACRFYLLGITQGISMGMSIADGKTQGGASLCSR
jgi:hypothetical protein